LDVCWATWEIDLILRFEINLAYCLHGPEIIRVLGREDLQVHGIGEEVCDLLENFSVRNVQGSWILDYSV
jgi:hypothetical protein